MPTVTCPTCATPAILPDPWPHQGFTCARCGTMVAFGAPLPPPPSPPAPFDVAADSASPSRRYRDRSTHSGSAFMTTFGGSLGCFAALVVVCVGVGFLVFAGKKSTPPHAEAKDAKDGGERAKEKPPRSETWAAADSSVTVGGVRVRLVETIIGKVPLRDIMKKDTSSADDLLKVMLEITNTSGTKKIDYRTWSGAAISLDRDYATLKDEHGNSYKRITFSLGTYPVAAVERGESIYPNQSLRDVLVFELPTERASQLNLELPARNFGGEGMVRFRIPVKDVARVRE